jgi:raffinose/stachyose/melibiose transport system permease protein
VGCVMRIKRLNWRHIPLFLVSLFALFPLFLLFINAFKERKELFRNPMGIPLKWTFDNFITAWEQGNYSVSYLNTLIITGSTVLFVCLFCSLAAFGLTHIRTKGANLLMAYLFISMSLPVNFIPIFFMEVKLGLINTHLGVIIPYVGGAFAFNVFLLRAFMIGIPKALFEAAKIDGCGYFRIFINIVIPLVKPALIVVAIFSTLQSWNEIFLANALLQEEAVRTVAVQYLTFASKFKTNWSLMFASGVLTILPMILMFLFMTRKFISGLQEGGVKF